MLRHLTERTIAEKEHFHIAQSIIGLIVDRVFGCDAAFSHTHDTCALESTDHILSNVKDEKTLDLGENTPHLNEATKLDLDQSSPHTLKNLVKAFLTSDV